MVVSVGKLIIKHFPPARVRETRIYGIVLLCAGEMVSAVWWTVDDDPFLPILR